VVFRHFEITEMSSIMMMVLGIDELMLQPEYYVSADGAVRVVTMCSVLHTLSPFDLGCTSQSNVLF